MPILAPRCLGSAAIVSIVSADAREIVDPRLVLIGDIADWRGQCDTHVEVWHGQQLRRPRLHPLKRRRALALWAMPIAAAIVGDGRVAAGGVFAAHDMPAEGRRAAVLDRVHHLELAKAQVTAVDLTPSGPWSRKISATSR